MSLLSRESSQPLTEQLAQRFVTRMRDQLLVSGARLPSVRQCAQMHGVSTSTVVAAYDWLVAQGWVEARPNRGFFVRDRVQRTPPPSASAGGVVSNPPPVNASSLIRGMFHQPSAEPQPGMGVFPPDWLDADFLPAALRKVVSSPALREASLRYGEPQGDSGLREVLSGVLASLGLHASPGQLITTVGATQALDIVSRTLLKAGETLHLENHVREQVAEGFKHLPPGRGTLEDGMKALEKKYEGQTVPLPPHWGGWRVSPETVEFWQGRRSRLHDRLVYTRGARGWKRVRLAP